MKTVSRECGSCDEETDQLKLGRIPAYITLDEENLNKQVISACTCQATLCTECGSVIPQYMTDEQLEEGEEKVKEAMIEVFPEREEEIRSNDG